METKANYALVGSIVIALMVSVVLFVLWLSKSGNSVDVNQFTIYFQNQSLDGLQQNSDVTMKGIKVGSVASFGISPRNIEQVRVEVKISKDTPVKVDTRAVIRRNLLTGFARIDLTDGSQNSPALTAVAEGEEYPVIPEGQTELATIADSLPAFVEDASHLVHRANDLMSDENLKSLNAALANIAAFSETLAQSRDEFRSLIENFNDLSDDLAVMSKSGASFAKDADKSLNRITTEMELALKEIRETTAMFNSSSSEMFESVRNSSMVISSKVGYASQELAEAAQSISATAERFEDPRALILGPKRDSLGPGEKLPNK